MIVDILITLFSFFLSSLYPTQLYSPNNHDCNNVTLCQDERKVKHER